MIYVHVTEEQTSVITSEEAKALNWVGVQDRHDWKTMQDAEDVALLLNLHSKGDTYIATDAGEWVSPRFDVIAIPQVGDDVSYSYNGDTYPCGKVESISETLKKIVTTEGWVFYRRRQTGAWVMNGMWSLVRGHVNELNPHF